VASRAVELAARLQRLLQRHGIEASRHASSMLLLAGGRLLATLHVYHDECVARLYKPWLEANRGEAELLRSLLEENCGGLRVTVEEAPIAPG